MDYEPNNNSSITQAPDDESRSAVNSLILDYYKKFGRKRDLEQYFSLSTAQSDIRDPSSIFWARMKAENESSDSGERSDNKKSDSSQELSRISIRFPAQDPCTSQEEDSKTKTESTSPPIIIEELPEDCSQNSEDDGMKSEEDAIKSDDNSQKSYDVLLDTSMNKLHSPSSSITSQRRLEWDSLADVGYANESDRKTSASSLSTLERLALKQQYSNNDTEQNSNLGVPTAHSTPLDENEVKSKCRKSVGKRGMKIYKKDVDFVEVNVPQSSNMNPAQSINVNLTKHISFNVEKDGKVTVDNILKDISVSPEKISVETETSATRMDREMQTSLTKTSKVSSHNCDNAAQHRIPIVISLNTLKRSRVRRRLRMARRKLKTKKRSDKEIVPVQEKSGEQVSEAESFEYMPGHIYNQNHMTVNNIATNVPHPNATDNKSSLESSGILTSDSSKGSKHSFTKDLEKSIDLLKSALKQRSDDSTLRKQLIQQVCQRLMKSKYRDDDSTTDFLSGLSFSSKKLGLGERNNTTTSTSDANNSEEKSKRPKKSILRTDKFNPGSIASTSQSVPNLPVASKSENLVTTNLAKNISTSNTESDMSSKEKTSSDNGHMKTSSEELYKKYLQALKREEAYKKHLKDKEMFLKQKLVCSDSALKVPLNVEAKSSNRLKELINDLTRNNYDDGSGDASKLEGGPSSHRDLNRFLPNRAQRSQSVFTLSSGNSDCQNKKPNLKKKLQCDTKDKPGPSKNSHYCCCPHHGNLKFTDSSVQVNIKNPCSDDTCHVKQNKLEQQTESPRRTAKIISDNVTGNLKYVCLCSKNAIQEAPDDFLIYKCCRLNNKGIQLAETSSKSSNEVYIQCGNDTCMKRNIEYIPSTQGLNNKSSQTNMLIKMLHEQADNNNLISAGDQKQIQIRGNLDNAMALKSTNTIYEATRWIQTEISINPKISEPTLSDINIVSDINCAKLISEHCREIPKPSLTDVISNQAVASTSAFSDSCRSTGTSKDIGNKTNNVNRFDDIEKGRKENITQETNIEHAENFTIPIHGTNMTLMVTIGSERFPNTNTKEMVTESIGTDKVNVIEQATSLREECSKGVQSDKTIDNIYIHKSMFADSDKKSLTVNTCLTTEEDRFGTYPKTSPVNDRKTFRRTNTDTDAIQSAIFTRNVATGESNESSIKCSSRSDGSSEYNPNQQDACPCGCKGKIENCKLDCIERKRAENKKSCFEQVSTHVDLKDKKCPCECGGTKNNCKKTCIEKSPRLTPRDSNKKQTSCGQQSTLDTLGATGEKCSCGCDGTKNTCKKSCKELKVSTEKQCGMQPIEQISTQTKNSLEQNDRCSCGCGGLKNTCKKTCKERKLSPKNEKVENRKQCGTLPMTKQISTPTNTEVPQKSQCGKQRLDNDNNNNMDTQTDVFPSQNSCQCGCGGTKERCKKSCEELKRSLRNEYLESSKCKNVTDKQINTQTDTEPTRMGQCGKQPKEIETQTDMALNQNEMCSCGCGEFKEKCKSSCKDYQSSPRTRFTGNINLSKKQSLDKAIDTQTDNSVIKYGNCPCGCDGEKNSCQKSCIELQSLRKNNLENNIQCVTQSNKQINTQTDMSLNQPEKCLCGCGGTKDNCQKNCMELKLAAREPIRKQDQAVYAAGNVLNVSGEKCSCGCGGMKNACKKTCKEVGSTPREDKKQRDNREVGIQKRRDESPQRPEEPKPCTSRDAEVRNTGNIERYLAKTSESSGDKTEVRSSDKSQKSNSETEPTDPSSDPILNLIQSITKKYTKNEDEKNKRKKCFKEIMTVLNYLLDTDELHDGKEPLRIRRESTTTADETDSSCKKVSEKSSTDKVTKKLVDKGVQPSKKPKSNPCATESSEVLTSTDIPGTSSDSAACKALNKIKKECEKYHQKRCKIHSGKNCDGTSSTSINCEQCRRIHHCQCRSHKCKNHKKSTEKMQKSPVAYNLILQTSESVMSEGPSSREKTRTLKNIIVKVPKKKPHSCMPFRELAAKFEKQMTGMPKDRCYRSKTLPNDSEISSMEEILRQSQGATVREYLEKNRPDFIEKCSQRQTCMRYISESRSNERAVKRNLLSLHLAQLPDVTELDAAELRQLAAELGRQMRDRKPAPKFISEREMKKHSEKIYKSLPEVVQKKEEKRKENNKKTNLLMANMFKRNLQKKTLRGAVNLSNYSSVIKI